MEEKVARKATFLYCAWAKKNKQKELLIRFFGGEPLMNFSVVKEVVAYAKKYARREKVKASFDLTTNGLLVNDGVIDFFRENPEINVIISLDGDAKTQNLNRNVKGAKIDSYKNIRKYKKELIALPNMTVNMVIAPNQVGRFYENFLHNYQLGFTRFNFLPAYFVAWKEKELGSLITAFNAVVGFLRTHKDISIKNTEVFSTQPFFNPGFVVDCNGDLFGTNMILSDHYTRVRDDLIMGNVLKIERNNLLHFDKDTDMVSIMRSAVDGTLFYASLKVDRILSNFVKKLNM